MKNSEEPDVPIKLSEEDKDSKFYLELTSLINRYSKENGSDTPDYILADYLIGCLKNFNSTVNLRETFYGRHKK